MLALIKNGAVKDVVAEGGGFTCEVTIRTTVSVEGPPDNDGNPTWIDSTEERTEVAYTSPAVDGWQGHGYKLMTIADAVPGPVGKVIVDTQVWLIDGVPTYVNTYEDAPPPVDPPRAMVAKSTVMQRLIDLDKMDQAYAMLTAQPKFFARWFAPDHPSVYCDDPDAMAFVTALELDPAAVLAAE